MLYTEVVIIPAGYAHILVGFTGLGAPTGAALTFGVQNDSDFDAPKVAFDIAEAWGTSAMTGTYSTNVTASVFKAKLGPNATGAAAEYSTAFVGGLGASGHPGAAYLVSKFTATGGRQGRGRCYIPGAAEGDVGPGGVILPANQDQITDRWRDFNQLLILGSLPMVLLHHNSLTPSPVTDLVCSGQVATQRRRNRR